MILLLCKRTMCIYTNEIFDAFACELLYEGKIAQVDQNHTITFDLEDKEIVKKAKKYNKTKGEIP